MSSFSSSAALKSKKKTTSRPRALRSPSASEIARNLKNFETWSSHQGCEQVSYVDLPDELKADVDHVFDMNGRLPVAWVNETSEGFKSLSSFATPELIGFIREAFDECPALFTEDCEPDSIPELYSEITIVFSAWRRLQKMRRSKEKWSEADYVANVYNVFRSPALRESTHRVHCTIALPQPLMRMNMGTQATRILSTKTVIPDCTIMIPANKIQPLSHSAKSPFKVLKSHASVVKSGSASKGSSFRYQSTPCANLPDTAQFEFISSFWEDKKPVHHMLEDAYRQNRMATASAVRHLHSLRIRAPVFGFVWASGSVKAHVDWCTSEEGAAPVVLSAPYPGDERDSVNEDDETSDIFYEWQLDRASDILQVYFLIRNIDRWTMGRFHELVVSGVQDTVDHVVRKGNRFEPWKRVGDLVPTTASSRITVAKENFSVSISVTTNTESCTSSPIPRAKSKRSRLR